MTLSEYFNGDELAASVWKSKYAAEGELTPDDTHRRLAKEFARKIKEREQGSPYTEERIYELFKNFRFIVPQGSVMSILGTGTIASLSNCFVIGQPKDSYSGILYKDEQLVQLMKRRGGVGIDLSTLRPAGVTVLNSAKSSTGAVSFMERFSNSTREVAQGGRRGALMISMDIRHPDIEKFINIKQDKTKVTGANISVFLRDDFMKAVEKDEDYILRWPCDTFLLDGDEPDEYNVLKKIPIENIYVKKVKAKEVYNQIIFNAWDNAEPGQMFLDKHINYSPDGVYDQFRIVTTNPCSEIGMGEYDACRLMAVNCFSFVKDPFTDNASIDWKLVSEVFYLQQYLADVLVDLELEQIDKIFEKIKSDPEPDYIKERELELWKNIKEVCSAGRRTGCGYTALGDMLAALGFKYDSDEALKIIEQLMVTKMESELNCSIDLAVLFSPFEGWDRDLEFKIEDGLLKGRNEFFQSVCDNFPRLANKMYKLGRRNVSWSTLAPTGSVSLMTQSTSGLEPLFSPFHFRRRKINPSDENVRVDFIDPNGDKWMEYPVLHPKFKDWLYSQHKSLSIPRLGIESSELIDPTLWEKDVLEEAFKYSPWYQATANDIDWNRRIEIQSIIQKYTSHSISSTINLPSDVTQEKVSEIYLEAWKKGLKGVTIYRDGCRTGVLITKKDTFEQKDAPKRPKELQCTINHIKVKGEPFTVIVGLLETKPYEVFAVPFLLMKDCSEGTLTKKSKGVYLLSCLDETVEISAKMSEEQETIARLISTSLRHGASIKFVCEQLLKTEGELNSFTKAIARVLKQYIPEGEHSTLTCSECGSKELIFQEGCLSCQHCGTSKCS